MLDHNEWVLHLLGVSPVHDVDHPLGVAVPEVGVVRGAVVDHCLIDRVRRLVRENAGRQAGHNL